MLEPNGAVARARQLRPRPRLRLPRPTIRLRLTLLYGAIFLVSGAALLGVTYVLVSTATGNPIVYRGQDGSLTVDFSEGERGGAGTTPTENPGLVVERNGDPPAPELDDPAILQALAEQQHAAEMNQLLAWSGVALAIMAFVSVGAGWFVAGSVLDPLRTLTADVRQISATTLEQRLALDGPDDELKDLGTTFNDLLGRLERSFDAQRQFVANASHELRTPLARQRTLIQVALGDPSASAETLRTTFERVLIAGTEQEALIEALLTLARGERGLDRHQSVDLAVVTAGVLEARRSDLTHLGLHVAARLDPLVVSGDPSLLQRLVANLVDNAMRYNEPAGRIELTTTRTAGAAVLRIANHGPVVPADAVERLFEPFERLGTDRVRHGDGWGLGLSIVRAIAVAHDAEIHASARPLGGLDVELTFQALDEDERMRRDEAKRSRRRASEDPSVTSAAPVGRGSA